MTQALEHAIARLKSLPEEQQDSLARLLIAEMDDDAKWEATTEANPGRVAELAAEVEAAYRRGDCEPLDPESL